MRKKLYIPCPQCQGGDSKYFRAEGVSCSYCRGARTVDILFHHRRLNIEDDRNANVKSFVNDPRFQDYLESKYGD